jgi:hypothetical protein
MAKLQSFKRIVKENFKAEDQELIDAIGGSINIFAEEVINAFNKNFTVDDNLKMEYKDIEVTVNASGIPINTTQFKVSFTGKIRGITVERAVNLTNPSTYPTGAPFITFDQNNQVITVNHITGLPANNKYRLTVLSKG